MILIPAEKICARLLIDAVPRTIDYVSGGVRTFRPRTIRNLNRNRKLKILTAPTKAKSREPAYSQALVQTKSIGSGSDPESQAGRQAGRQAERTMHFLANENNLAS